MFRSARKTGTLALVTLSLAVLLTFVTTAVQVPVASAHSTTAAQQTSSVIPNDVNNCGIVTCSYYFSRAHTRWIAVHGVYLAIADGIIPGWVAKIISVVIGVVTAKAAEAAGRNQCLRVRYGLIVGLYSDGSGFCRNT